MDKTLWYKVMTEMMVPDSAWLFQAAKSLANSQAYEPFMFRLMHEFLKSGRGVYMQGWVQGTV